VGYNACRGYPRAVGYQAALIHWVEERLREQPDDPFPAVLALQRDVRGGEGPGRADPGGQCAAVDPDTSEVVSRLRLAVIERRKAATAGAHLVQGLTARHPDNWPFSPNSWGSTPSGEMARYQVARNQHLR